MNQYQVTMTAGDDRTLAFIVPDDYEGDTATLRVDELFEKTATVGADDGSGYATVSFTIDADDTDDDDDRRVYRYSISVSHDGDRLTIRRGLFVVTARVPEVG